MRVDARELLGSLLQRGMTDSSQRRIENSLSETELGGILEREFGAAPAKASAPSRIPSPTQARVPVGAQAGPSRAPSRPVEAPKAPSAPEKSAKGGGLADLFGSSFKGAAGAGALALLGSIAKKVLRGSSQSGQSGAQGSASRLFSGMEEEESVSEEQHAQSLADLIVKAMVNAAKADGAIDEDEMQKVVGELQGDGISQAEREFLLAEVRKPMCTAEIVRAVIDRQVGTQVYTASLLAIEVDTPAEKAYLQQLAGELGLNSQVVEQIHATLGVV